MDKDFLLSIYSFEEQVVTKAYKNTINNFINDFQKLDINDAYKLFLVLNNKKYSLGKYKALQIASFEYLYFNENLKDVDLIDYSIIDTPDGKQFFPPVYNKSLVVRNKHLIKRQLENKIRNN